MLHRLKIVEQSKDCFELHERPSYFPALVLLAIAAAPVIVPWPLALIALPFSALVLGFALYACVDSDISMESGTVRIKRNLFGRTWERRFSAPEIAGVYEVRIRNGRTLRMRLMSGKDKRLSLFSQLTPLDDVADELNRRIHDARESGAA
jgi:hypothetical protein